MATRFISCCILTGAVAVLAATPHAAARQARGARERTVIATVLDHDGKPVAGLGVGDFAVREGDVIREVLRVGPATGPMQLMLLADTSAAAEPAIPDLRRGLGSFVTAILAKSPESQVAIMSFGERPTQECDYTTNAATIQKSIQRLFQKPGSGSYLLEAIDDAAKGLKKRQATRPVIVAFSSEGSPEFSNQSYQQIGDVLKDGGVTLWAVVLQVRASLRTSDAEQNRATVLGDVTTQSGGMRDEVLVRTAIEPTYVALAARLASQYAVTYSRPESLIPPDKLDVTVKREGLRILAPHWTGK